MSSRPNQPSSLQGLTIAELTILNGLISAIKDRVPAAGDMKPEIVFTRKPRAGRLPRAEAHPAGEQLVTDLKRGVLHCLTAKEMRGELQRKRR
jgi:hypothetical protein